MRTTALTVLAGLVLLGASMHIATPDAARAATLSGKLTRVQYLIGTWSCVTKVSTPAQTQTGRYRFWIEPDNVIGNYYRAKGYSGSGYIGWMPSERRWWSNSAGRFGGISYETGENSATNVQLLTGSTWFQGQPSPSRDTITKDSGTRFRDVFEMKTKGKWAVVADSSCTKTSDKTP